MCNPAGWWGAGSSPRHPPCIEGCSTADSVPHPPSQGLGTPVTPLPRSLPEAEGSVENDSFEVAESQAIMSRLQWDGSSDISPSDSASSKASECWGWGGGEGKSSCADPPAGEKLGVPGVSPAQEGTDRQTMATQSHLEESLEYLLGHLVTYLPGVGGMFWGTFSSVWIGDGGIFCVLVFCVSCQPSCTLTPPSPPFLPPPRYKQLRVPQDQEEEAPLGAGEWRPGARLQQEEEAQTPCAPHPQHLRRHQLSPAELMVGGTDRQMDTGRGSPSRPSWGSPVIRTQSGYPGHGGWRTWPSLQGLGWGWGAGLGSPH